VHHHPDLHHKKKNFKEYFLEFVMIFLAVTLGFFAENIREHYSDKSKEQEFVVSLKEGFDCILAERQKALALRLITLIKKEYHYEMSEQPQTGNYKL